MDQYEINAAVRNVQGKGASRRLRRDGKIPAILYGAGQEPINIELQHHEMARKTEHESFYSRILTLKLDGRNEKVVLKDLQRHPVKPQILHMDLQRVDEHEYLTMRVPLHFMNESQCVGVKRGGVISHLLTELEVVCLPKDLPEYVEVDVGEMDIGDTCHLSDLRVPEGVRIAAEVHGGDLARAVVSVQVPRVVVEVEELEAEAEAEVEAAEEGEAAAAEAADQAPADDEGS